MSLYVMRTFLLDCRISIMMNNNVKIASVAGSNLQSEVYVAMACSLFRD